MRPDGAGPRESALLDRSGSSGPFEGVFRPPRSPFLSLAADRPVNAHRAVCSGTPRLQVRQRDQIGAWSRRPPHRNIASPPSNSSAKDVGSGMGARKPKLHHSFGRSTVNRPISSRLSKASATLGL